MRVLAVAAPLVGHLAPLLPLATALRDAGHEVLLATGGDAMGLDVGGLPREDVAPGVRFGRIAARVALTHPRLAVRELSGRAGTRLVGRLFGEVNDRMADALVALARQWRPDLVLHESLGAAGAVAAAVVGVPAVLQESNLWDGTELFAVTCASRPLSRALRRHHVDVPRLAAVIRTAPARLVGIRPGPRMRAVPHSGGGELPDWLAEPGDRPRVLVSRSTTAGGPGGDPSAAVLAAAGAVDAEFVLVRGPQGKQLPPNVRVTGWIPLDRALPHAAAFVHHGGAGGVLQALASGVPQLAVPGAGDRRYNAELLARHGAGLAVESGRISAAVLTRLVTDGGLRRVAQEVGAELAAMPAPAEMIPPLVALAGRG